jgi:hypothetical protein
MIIKTVPMNMSAEEYNIGISIQKSTQSHSKLSTYQAHFTGAAIYFDAKYIVRGNPYISMNNETKKAVTTE